MIEYLKVVVFVVIPLYFPTLLKKTTNCNRDDFFLPFCLLLLFIHISSRSGKKKYLKIKIGLHDLINKVSRSSLCTVSFLIQ